ncbi:unnamed protein product [Psylliodes chrysocephalus]|uniref:Mutator-like transposase domain-containing protein n=1 Tax=Psylliodes chrysocephalus TaxID=3402493 RepID=A0A9P0GIL3_9CUCU|nr:unnamed protein product [Psylliodes chrysocephala]
MCNMAFQITTSQENVNKDAVIGVTSIRSAFAHLEQISASLDIPCMSQRLYSKVHDKISDDLEETSMQTIKDAAEEERRLAIAEGEVDKNGTPLITVVVDGSWAKRSYGSSYNSLSGAAAIVGFRTKKVLFFGVRNKFCTLCNFSLNKNEEYRMAHRCYKNWSGSAASLKADIIAEDFQKKCGYIQFDIL